MAEEPDITSRFDHTADDPHGRPKSVTALASLGIFFGALGLLLLPWALWEYMGRQEFPPFEVQASPAFSWWVIGSAFLGLLLSSLLLMASAGALAMRRWGRPVFILWAAMSLAYGIVGCYFNSRWLLPSHRREIAGILGVGQLSVLYSWVIGTLLAIFAIYYMTRPHVRDAFRHLGSLPPDEAEEG